MIRFAVALALLAAGTAQCGGGPPASAPEVSTSAVALFEEDEDAGIDRTVRCGDSYTTYRSMSESAIGYSQSAAKRICRQKLVNRINKGTRCDTSRCGSGSCRPDGEVHGTSYDCERSGSDYRCRCRPTTIEYACTSCSR